MYNNDISCMSINGKESDYFVTLNGACQGENLSSPLFAFYVNDGRKILNRKNQCEY